MLSSHFSTSKRAPMDTSKKTNLPYGSSATPQARQMRLDFLKESGVELKSYGQNLLSETQVKSNIEAFIGSMTIPVGLAGPLLYKEESESELTYAPIATTEGALVASMNRGAKAITNSGGFKAQIIKKTMLRAPLFRFKNMSEAIIFEQWLNSKKDYLKVHAKNFSKHGELREMKTILHGRDLEAKFYFDSADAAGQNMTTICTWNCCLWIQTEFEKENTQFNIEEFLLDGNGGSDKKLSYDSMINGRGVDVVGECFIDEEDVRSVLKTTSEQIVKWYNTIRPIARGNGMIGENINVANAIAGIFVSCGQDIACVHESAVGILNFEKHERGLYVSLRLPKLVIGTIGGGTSLPSQKDNLKIMNCYGPGKVERFAKLICGYSLALEVSTAAALVSGQFAIAHERLGRNKGVKHLDEKTIQDFLKNHVLWDRKSYIEFKDKFYENNGIITQITNQSTDKLLGLSLWNISTENTQEIALVKSKPTSKETLNCMYVLTGMLDPELAADFKSTQENSDFARAHKSEIEIYNHLAKKKINSIPKIYGTFFQEEREIYLILMEFLKKEDLLLFNSEMKSELWTGQRVLNILSEHFKNVYALEDVPNREEYKDRKYRDLCFIENSLRVIEDEYGDKLGEFNKLFNRSLEFIKENESHQLPTHIVHNDFNPRNIALSKKDRVIVYDWELACEDIIQRDIMELLAFIADNKMIQDDFESIKEKTVKLYCEQFNQTISLEQWELGLKLGLAKFICTRLSIYLLGNKLTEYNFTLKVVSNSQFLAKELGL